MDESTNSVDVTSSIEENDTQVPTIVVTSPAAHLETMGTLDDVDDDEAFISDLMAMHPNDDDIVVEDLEEIDEAVSESGHVQDSAPVESTLDVTDRRESTEDGVRQIVCSLLCIYRSLLLNYFHLVVLLSRRLIARLFFSFHVLPHKFLF